MVSPFQNIIINTIRCRSKSFYDNSSFIRKYVEMTRILTGFPLKTRGNDKQDLAFKIVILGLDPGIQSLFNFYTKDTNSF